MGTFLDSCLFFLSRIGNEKQGIFQKLTPRRPVNRKNDISRQREQLESSFNAHFVGLVAGNIFGFVSFFPISHRKRENGRKKKRKKVLVSFCRSRRGQHFWIRVFFFLSLIGNEKPGIFQKLTPVNAKNDISQQREELESSFKAHSVGLVAGNIFGFGCFFPISQRQREARVFHRLTPRRPVNRKSDLSRQRKEVE